MPSKMKGPTTTQLPMPVVGQSELTSQSNRISTRTSIGASAGRRTLRELPGARRIYGAEAGQVSSTAASPIWRCVTRRNEVRVQAPARIPLPANASTHAFASMPEPSRADPDNIGFNETWIRQSRVDRHANQPREHAPACGRQPIVPPLPPTRQYRRRRSHRPAASLHRPSAGRRGRVR